MGREINSKRVHGRSVDENMFSSTGAQMFMGQYVVISRQISVSAENPLIINNGKNTQGNRKNNSKLPKSYLKQSETRLTFHAVMSNEAIVFVAKVTHTFQFGCVCR